MILYLLRRVAYAVPIALSVSLVCFMLVHIAPGDPIDLMVSPDTPKAVVDQVRRDYGLDRPLPVQFGLWLGHVVQGDLGRSLANRRPVAQDLFVAGRKTFLLAMAAALGFTAGCALGGLAAAFRGTWIDRACVTAAVAGVSIPHYWLGMVLVILFSVQLNWLPAMGAGGGGAGEWLWDWDHVRFLILPAVTLSAIPAGIVTRTLRGSVIEILGQDFVTTLRGKGLRRAGVLLHVVKNAAPTALAVGLAARRFRRFADARQAAAAGAELRDRPRRDGGPARRHGDAGGRVLRRGQPVLRPRVRAFRLRPGQGEGPAATGGLWAGPPAEAHGAAADRGVRQHGATADGQVHPGEPARYRRRRAVRGGGLGHHAVVDAPARRTGTRSRTGCRWATRPTSTTSSPRRALPRTAPTGACTKIPRSTR